MKLFSPNVRFTRILVFFQLVIASAASHGMNLRVTSVPIGATVYVNDKPNSRPTPCSVNVDIGDTLQVRLPGYEVAEGKVKDDKTRKVTMKLKEITEFKLLLEAKTSNKKKCWYERSQSHVAAERK